MIHLANNRFIRALDFPVPKTGILPSFLFFISRDRIFFLSQPEFLYIEGGWDRPNFYFVKIERYWDYGTPIFKTTP